MFENSVLRWRQDGTADQDLRNFRAKLAVNTLCDEEGNNLLKPSDVDTLSRHISAEKMARIVEVAGELNKVAGFFDAEQEVKNSEDGQSESSTSDSAVN